MDGNIHGILHTLGSSHRARLHRKGLCARRYHLYLASPLLLFRNKQHLPDNEFRQTRAIISNRICLHRIKPKACPLAWQKAKLSTTYLYTLLYIQAAAYTNFLIVTCYLLQPAFLGYYVVFPL